jgi:hypothetical protein
MTEAKLKQFDEDGNLIKKSLFDSSADYMVVGQLYMADLSSYRSYQKNDDTRKRWEGKPVLYLGEDIINRSDGVTVVNHKFLVGGAVTATDVTFLKYIKEIEL